MFGIILLVIVLLTIGFIPFKFIKTQINDKTKDLGIELIYNNPWYVKIFKAGLASENILLKIKLSNNNEVSLGCEKIYINPILKTISMENVTMVTKGMKELYDTISLLNNKENNNGYTVNFKNLTIKSINLATSNGKKIDYNEILLTALKIENNDHEKNISVDFNSKNNNPIHFEMISRYDSNKKLNFGRLKFKSDTADCRGYFEKDQGQVLCDIDNVGNTLDDIGYKYKSFFTSKILDRSLHFKIDINSDNNSIKGTGDVSINSDKGKIAFNEADHTLQVSFDGIDFDSKIGSIKQNSLNLSVYTDNPWIKENKEATTFASAGDLSSILRDKAQELELGLKVKVKNILYSGVKINDFWLDAYKKGKSDDISLNKIYATINSNGNDSLDILLIENTDNKYSNISIIGEKFQTLIQLAHSDIMSDNISAKYDIQGTMLASINGMSINNYKLSLDKNEIITGSYSIDIKNDIIKKEIKIHDVDLNKIFSTDSVYKKIYKVFQDSQESRIQVPVIKLILQNSLSNKKNDTSLTLENCQFDGMHINKVQFKNISSSQAQDIYFFNNNDLLQGNIVLNILNSDDINAILDVNIKNFNYNLWQNFIAKFNQVNNVNLQELTFSDKEYNIPSLIGIDGKASIKINAIKKNPSDGLSSILCAGSLSDGIIEFENCQYSNQDNKIALNGIINLKTSPKFDFGFAASGFSISGINKNVQGSIAAQGKISFFGFNPVQWIKQLKGSLSQLKFLGISVTGFDLYGLSKAILKNQPNIKYEDILNGTMMLPVFGNDASINNGVMSGKITFDREILSCDSVYEYNIFDKRILKFEGNCAIAARGKNGNITPIYVPFACNGRLDELRCINNTDNIKTFINAQ